MTTSNTEIQKKSPMDWIVRLLKGILVGIGFITPGLSGGVLAVVFGLYERLMRWLGNLKEQFLKNLLFFLPVGIGGVIGVVAFSAAVDWAFENYRVQAIWLFIGFIAGTFPSLLKTAGKEGRKSWHWLLLVFAAVGMFFLMRWMETIRSMEVAPSFFSWLLSGALIGLGVVVPGMSPSNFLIYLGLYEKMTAGISRLDLGVMIPLALGGLVCVLLFAKLVSWLFKEGLCLHVPLDFGRGGRLHRCNHPQRGKRLGRDRCLRVAVPGGGSHFLRAGQAGREVRA